MTFGIQELMAIGGTITFNSAAQLLLRTGLKDVDIAGMVGQRAFGDIAQSLSHPAVLGGVASFAVGLGFWFLAISRMPASVAYPMISLAYVTVVVLSWMFLNEHIGWQKLSGSLAIIIGVAVIAKSP
jgi:drug/metabolite transporter (DMT)-like permease